MVPVACLITQMNTKLNNVSVKLDRGNLIGHPVWYDYNVILIGDMLYNYKEVVLMVPWLDRFDSVENNSVYIGDPGRPYLTVFKRRHHLFRVAEYHLSATSRYLNRNFEITKVYKYFHIKPRRLKPKQLRIFQKTTRRPRGTKWPKRPTLKKERPKHKRKSQRKPPQISKKKKRKLKGKVKGKKS